MFKAVKDNKIIAISDTDSTFLCLVCDAIANEPDHTVADYVQVNGEFVLTSSAEAIEQKQAEVRAVRNQYLTDTDKYMIPDFPITEEEEAQYIQYREYLRNYPETENWYEQNPLTFEEWKEDLNATEQIKTMGDVYGTVQSN